VKTARKAPRNESTRAVEGGSVGKAFPAKPPTTDEQKKNEHISDSMN
jgi:hypothetical protein